MHILSAEVYITDLKLKQGLLFLVLVPKLDLRDLEFEDPSLAGLLILAECLGVRSFFSGVVLNHFVIFDQFVDGLELPIFFVKLELPL